MSIKRKHFLLPYDVLLLFSFMFSRLCISIMIINSNISNRHHMQQASLIREYRKLTLSERSNGGNIMPYVGQNVHGSTVDK